MRARFVSSAPVCTLNARRAVPPALAALFVLLAGALTGCASGPRTHIRAFSPEERVVAVKLGTDTAKLGASWVPPTKRGAPVVIFVPGGGPGDRHGRTRGDGHTAYDAPVDVMAQWAAAFARRGYGVLAYDKRTCDARTSPGCRDNPTADVDKLGPAAMSKDVNAACAFVAAEPSAAGRRVVLFTHGQGTQVVLASRCAKTADMLVLAAPIPGRVDHVMVDSAKRRAHSLTTAAKKAAASARTLEDEAAAEAGAKAAAEATNKAASLEAMFSAMQRGRFKPGARVMGATVPFWLAWVQLTGRTKALAAGVRTPRVVVLGGGDGQYGPKARTAIRALAKPGRDVFVLLKGADHHLLSAGKLAEGGAPVVDVVDTLWREPGQS